MLSILQDHQHAYSLVEVFFMVLQKQQIPDTISYFVLLFCYITRSSIHTFLFPLNKNSKRTFNNLNSTILVLLSSLLTFNIKLHSSFLVFVKVPQRALPLLNRSFMFLYNKKNMLKNSYCYKITFIMQKKKKKQRSQVVINFRWLSTVQDN